MRAMAAVLTIRSTRKGNSDERNSNSPAAAFVDALGDTE
jgi:hypothetical protein